MPSQSACVAGLGLFVVGAIALAAEAPTFEITELTDHLHLLTTDQGSYTTHTILMIGDDGILLVDTQAEDVAEELKRVVDGYGMGVPKIIINTHRHVEHVGGNAVFGNEPVVIAHELVRSKLRSGGYLFDEFPEETLPDITLADSLTIYFNGEKIRIIALAGSHDDNEVIVHFTESKVVHLSSLVNGFNFPSVDSDGDVLKFPEVIARAMDLLPRDVRIVSGHNRIGRWNELGEYREMLLETTRVIRAGLAAGKDLATLQSEKVLSGWDRYAGSYVSTEDWIEYLVNGLEGKKPKKTIFEPVYYSLRDAGLQPAIDKYAELKKHPDEYEIDDVSLLVIGDKLLKKGRAEEAARFLELCIQEFPEGTYGYYTSYRLASAYRDLGRRNEAIRYCEKALELNPEFPRAASLLEALKGM